MSQVRHHQHVRKRISNKQPYPHSTRWIRYLDTVVIVLGFGKIFATLSQVQEIWVGKDAAGVSVTAWTYYTFMSAVLFLYGYVHHDKPIMITSIVGVITCAIVTIGAIIY